MDNYLRPSNTIKYENDYWAAISKAVGKILHNNNTTRVSFEEMYSIVYKCVCDGFAERLHSDLLAQCSNHLEQVNRSLDTGLRDVQQCPTENDANTKFVMDFHQVLESYMIAVQHITPIFAYLNKFYVEVTLQTSLQTEVLDLFRLKIADPRIDSLIACVEVLLARPFALAPSAASALFLNLHRLGRGDYARRFPYLFARYITNVLPPMEREDLDKHIREVAELQVQLRAQQQGSTTAAQAGAGAEGEHGRKRRGDEDNAGPPIGAGAPTYYSQMRGYFK